MTTETDSGPGGRRPAPLATVVVVTRNRAAELRAALDSCLAQSAPVEVIVIDDASADDTAGTVRRDYPSVRLETLPEPRGYIHGRNLAAGLAAAPVIVSLDDDARFGASTIVEATLADFAHPAIAAVAMPYVDVHVSPAVRCRAPDRRRTWLTDTFVGTAHAIRRDVFLELGGFRTDYVHQVEEQELAMRLLRRGRFVALGNAEPILHAASPVRDRRRVAVHEARNNLSMSWEHLPTVPMLRSLARNACFFALEGAANGHLGPSLRGLGAGFRAIASGRARRAPMTGAQYRRLRELRRAPPRVLGPDGAPRAP